MTMEAHDRYLNFIVFFIENEAKGRMVMVVSASLGGLLQIQIPLGKGQAEKRAKTIFINSWPTPFKLHSA